MGWTLMAAAAVVAGFAASEGEPVCEGPFIAGAEDSFPPQCPDPALPLWVVVVWLLGTGIIVGLAALVRAERRANESA